MDTNMINDSNSYIFQDYPKWITLATGKKIIVQNEHEEKEMTESECSKNIAKSTVSTDIGPEDGFILPKSIENITRQNDNPDLIKKDGELDSTFRKNQRVEESVDNNDSDSESDLEKDRLIKRAFDEGIKIDKRWGIERIRDALKVV